MPTKQACKGPTLDRVAAIGCAVSNMLGQPAVPSDAPHRDTPSTFWLEIADLTGSDPAPRLIIVGRTRAASALSTWTHVR